MQNKQLYIDQEALATLGLLQEGMFFPVVKLMNEKEMYDIDKTKLYKGSSYPFPFILAPSGNRNEEVLKNLKSNETVDLICDGEICGNIICDDVFSIDKDKRVKQIYGTNNPEHLGVKYT